MKKLSIIVPYRDREEHLKKFAPHMKMFLDNKVDFTINIIEQHNNKTFNRGYLKNIGFDLTKNDSDYSCFHDIDQIPMADSADYSYVEGAAKLCIYTTQVGFKKRPLVELGGVVIFDNKSFDDINGFSNDYWGWGTEDLELGIRCNKKNVPIKEVPGRYMALPHRTEGDTVDSSKTSRQTRENRKIFEEVTKDENKLFSSGLSTLDYKLIEKEKKELYTIYRVDF